MANSATQRIAQATRDCFGTPGDLADLTAGLLRSNPKEAKCAGSSLSGLLSVPPEDLYIPPTAIPLIRHVYHRLPPPLHYNWENLVDMIGLLEKPTPEAVLFLEEIYYERDPELFFTPYGELRIPEKFGRARFPFYLRRIREMEQPDFNEQHYMGSSVFYRVVKKWLEQHATIGWALWKMGFRPEDISPLVEAMAANPAMLDPGLSIEFQKLVYPISQMGAPALEELSLLCREGSIPVCLVALKAMAKVGMQMPYYSHPVSDRLFSEYFLEALRDSFKKEDVNLTETAISLLASATFQIPERPLWTMIFNALEDPDANVRYGLAMAIVRNPVLSGRGKEWKNALPFLAAMKEGDPDERCRNAARDAIQKIEKQIF